MKIAQVTDLHLDDFMADDSGADGRGNFLVVLDAIKNEGISDIVVTGDLGNPSSQQWLFDTIAARNLKPFFVLGNHDRLADIEYRSAIPDLIRPDGLYYSKTIADIPCIFLDSSRGIITGEQLHWFGEQLARDTQNVVIFTHYPIVDCGDTAMDRLYPLENRERLMKMLADSHKRISIFCGHYHTTHEQKTGDISQYVTPSTLLQIKQNGDKIEVESMNFGYRLIHLSPDNIQTEAALLRP